MLQYDSAMKWYSFNEYQLGLTLPGVISH